MNRVKTIFKSKNFTSCFTDSQEYQSYIKKGFKSWVVKKSVNDCS